MYVEIIRKSKKQKLGKEWMKRCKCDRNVAKKWLYPRRTYITLNLNETKFHTHTHTHTILYTADEHSKVDDSEKHAKIKHTHTKIHKL